MGSAQIGFSKALAIHAVCALGLAAGYWLARDLYSLSLVADPAQTLRLVMVFEAPIVLGIYSSVRRDMDGCSYLKAVGRGLLGLPVGALLNAFGAIVLGAPVGIKYLTKTIYWSFLMSLFTFVPATCVFGSSKMDWQRLLAVWKPTDGVDYMISLPAHGAVIGAWLGAWPMPLDWERPWQEWPICVTYGAVGGYVVGMLLSSVFVLLHSKEDHVKTD